MTTIQLRDADLAEEPPTGTMLDAAHYDRVVRETTAVLKPDGSLLLIYIADALPRTACDLAFQAFRDVRLESRNRAMGQARAFPIKRNGYRSRTSQVAPVPSGVVGYFDREPRTPYCRMTAFTVEHPEVFAAVRPFVLSVNDTFRRYAPDRWAAQRAFIERVSPEFTIRSTVFTTMTVNKTLRTPAHRDKRDYRPGLGVMAALEGGCYFGGELVFPRYRTAVDMRTGGVCLADVHELHGNAPIDVVGSSRRLSFVFYARERMDACGSTQEELTRART